MNAKSKVIEGLTELTLTPEGDMRTHIISAIAELGYPDFFDHLYELYKQHGDNGILVYALCQCATRNNIQVIQELIESDIDANIITASTAAERLILTELIPVLENMTPPERTKRNIRELLEFLKDNQKTQQHP